MFPCSLRFHLTEFSCVQICHIVLVVYVTTHYAHLLNEIYIQL